MENEEKKPGVEQPALKIARRLQENKDSLRIGRVPPKTKEAFTNLAEEEFCGDYGMTLKWLMDDIMSQDMRVVLEKLQEFEERISVLEQTMSSGGTPDEDKGSVKKMLSGNKKRMNRNG